MPNLTREVLIPEARIQERIRELGAQIDADYPGGTVCLIAILKGPATCWPT
jgi:hypoxanthine-guanine phosphoribosyltransferase